MRKNKKRKFSERIKYMLKKIMVLFMLFSFLCPKVSYATGTSAESAIIINADTRQVLYADNAYKRLGMASTTKIMTALVALEMGNTTDIIEVSVNAQNQEGSSIYLRTGEKLTLEDLLYGLMLNSGNDAAVAIAEGVGGSVEDFVKIMNEKAKEIGCRDTHFANPNGLNDPEHYSTAYDMAILMAHAMENDAFRKIVSTKEYQITTPSTTTYLRNHNKLLWQYEYCIGGKTGYTRATGRCFVSAAERDGVELVAVTLNDRDDWRDHKNLHDYAFGEVKKITAISANEILCTRKIRGVRVNILAKEDFDVALKGGKKRGMICKIHLDETVNGEIRYGTQLGYADVFVGDFRVGSVELISGQSVEDNPGNAFCDTLSHMLSLALLNN